MFGRVVGIDLHSRIGAVTEQAIHAGAARFRQMQPEETFGNNHGRYSSASRTVWGWHDRFLGLGVQKGGTTTLDALLRQHPGLALPRSKELRYFSLHYGLATPGMPASHGVLPDQRKGEITPYYTSIPGAED